MFLDSGEAPALFAGSSGGGGKWVKMGRKKKKRRKKTDSKRRRRRPKPRMGFRVGGGAMRERAHAPFFPGNFASEMLYILNLISFSNSSSRRRSLPPPPPEETPASLELPPATVVVGSGW